jgi:MFS family permease
VARASLCACVPAALGAFDFGLLALAAPRIAPALGVGSSAYPWLFSASSFAYGAAVMAAASLTARLRPPRALGLGLIVTALGIGASALSSALATTLAARVLFGLGGALAATAALALLAATEQRGGRAAGFAALGGAVAAGFAAGTLAAGAAEWRLVPPAGAARDVIARRVAEAARADAAVDDVMARRDADLARGCAASDVLADTARHGSAAGGPRGRVEGVALTVAIVLVAVALALAGEWVALVPAAGALAAFAVFVRHATGGAPLAAACGIGAATTATGVGATIVIGAALAAERLPPSLLGVFGLGVVPGAWVARRLVERAGPPVGASAGIALQGLALAAVALALAMSASPLVLAVAIACFGAGHVAANAGAAAAALTTHPPARSAALLIAAQYVGGGTGSLAATAIAAAHGAAAAVLVAAAVAFVPAVGMLARSRFAGT